MNRIVGRAAAMLLLATATCATTAAPDQPGAASPVTTASAAAPAQSASSAQWLPADGAFPAPPSANRMQAAFPRSNYGAANYASPAGGRPPAQDGVAPLPALAPPSDYDRARALVSPLSEADIRKLRTQFDSSRKAKAYRPVRTSPRIRSASVDLSPGSSLPILRTLPSESSTLVFLDASGTPWPLAAVPRVARPDVASAEWLEGTPSIVVSMLSPYEETNLTVFLAGLATPVVVKLTSGEPDSKDQVREVDYRLDLRVPGHSPWAKPAIAGEGKVALYDDTMQAFLDGLPPQGATRLKPTGEVPPRTEVWQFANALFVRTDLDIQTAFDNTLAASDGTRVYRLPPTPYVTLSQLGRSVTFQVDIQ